MRTRTTKREFKPFLPTVIFGSVQPLNNKLDELHTNVQYHENVRTCSLMSFSEIWLHDKIADVSMTV